MRAALTVLAACLLAPAAQAQQVCGGDIPCRIDGGQYYVVLPEDATNAPSVIFLHGFGGSGAGSMRQTAMVAAMTRRGYAVIAPDGQPRDGAGGLRWDFRGTSAERRNEDAFLRDVLADAAARHGLDPDRSVLSGFSNGAFQVAYQACRSPGDFAAYAPVSGTFWRPQPESCAGPVRLLQTHGWRDGTVPLEGRPLGGGRVEQGDVFAGLALWRDTNGCDRDDPTGHSQTGQFLRREWTCAEGATLEMALFPGGHGVPQGWAEMMLDWFEALPEG